MNISTSIIEIYARYKVPEPLQLHMLRVAAVALQISKNWRGPEIDERLLKRVLLIHDIGNIVKMDKPDSRVTKIEEFDQVRERMIARFGTDDHVASSSIAKELGFSDQELTLLCDKIFIKNESTLASTDYNLKIAAYADQRVAPTGVMKLEDRLNEAKQRYKNKPGSSMNNPRTEFLIRCAIDIEHQIQNFSTLPLENISDSTIETDIEILKRYRF